MTVLGDVPQLSSVFRAGLIAWASLSLVMTLSVGLLPLEGGIEASRVRLLAGHPNGLAGALVVTAGVAIMLVRDAKTMAALLPALFLTPWF